MLDIVEKLRNRAECFSGTPTYDELLDAADEIESLRDALVFAEGVIRAAGSRHMLADLYAEDCPKQQVIERAGCFRRRQVREIEEALDKEIIAGIRNRDLQP